MSELSKLFSGGGKSNKWKQNEKRKADKADAEAKQAAQQASEQYAKQVQADKQEAQRAQERADQQYAQKVQQDNERYAQQVLADKQQRAADAAAQTKESARQAAETKARQASQDATQAADTKTRQAEFSKQLAASNASAAKAATTAQKQFKELVTAVKSPPPAVRPAAKPAAKPAAQPKGTQAESKPPVPEEKPAPELPLEELAKRASPLAPDPSVAVARGSASKKRRGRGLGGFILSPLGRAKPSGSTLGAGGI